MATLEEISGRDKRTSLAYGKEAQNKIYNTSVMVVGSDCLAQFIVAGLAGLGIRKGIYLIDNKRITRQDKNDFLCFKDNGKVTYIMDEKVKNIGKLVKKINDNSNVVSIFFRFNEALAYRYNPHIVIDATNDPESKEDVLRYSIRYGKPFISLSSDRDKGIISVHHPTNSRLVALKQKVNLENLIHEEFQGKYQGNVTSGVIAGIGLEEVRKFIFRMSEFDVNLLSDSHLIYNINASSRKDKVNDLRPNKDIELTNYNVLVVGAGGIGTYAALNLALIGVKNITIIDNDNVDITNLNRQILYYDAVGQPKAKVMAQRLAEINPKIHTSYEQIRIDRGSEKIFNRHLSLLVGKRLNNYDLVLGCTDNRETRLLLDEFCFKYDIPYIDGSTDLKSGKIVFYIPGKTPRIFEQTDYPERAASCAVADPSVVMSNMVIGSNMAAEALKVFGFEHYKTNPFEGIFRYDLGHPGRIYISRLNRR